MSEDEVWDTGTRHVAQPRGEPLLGRADIQAPAIWEHKLMIEPAPSPHPCHANITNWPDDKAKMKSIAQLLAAEAQLQLK